MAATEERGFPRRLWQQLKKFPEAFFIPTKVWRKLPENRPQFFLERENAGSKEICQGHFNLAQFFHVGDETPAFDAEEKIFRCLLVPASIARRLLQRIERTVDLNGIKCTRGELQFATMLQL